MEKIYISLSKLSTFLDNLKTTFATITHKHTISDLTDYTVDAELSSTSTNPVQNKVLNEEFDSVATAINALEAAIDTNLEAAKSYADDHDAFIFELSDLNSGGVTFEELYSYALQNRMIIAISNNSVYYFSGINNPSSDNPELYFINHDTSCDWTLTLGSGSTGFAIRQFISRSNPVGSGSFSLNRKSGSTVGTNSVATGYNTTASGTYSYAEGDQTIASGHSSHAEGTSSTASGDYSHAEGHGTASGMYSHAEGSTTVASGMHSHAEGYKTTASASYSHAEGQITNASGAASHTEGRETEANGWYSHAEGRGVKAYGAATHAQGTYNIDNNGDSTTERTSGTYIHIVGNGTNDDNRSNAHTLDWDGNAWFAGDVYVGSTSGTNKDDGSVKLATLTEMQTYVDEAVSQNETKADVDHTHDDRYYTETEIDSKLSGKADTSHEHTHITDGDGTVEVITSKISLTDAIDLSLVPSLNSGISLALPDDAYESVANLGTKTRPWSNIYMSTQNDNIQGGNIYIDGTRYNIRNDILNKNAFSNIAVGSTTVAANSISDTVTFAGSNITITPDATNDKITFSVADGTTSAKGVVQLTDSTSSTSTTTAATPNSVKSAYDLATAALGDAAIAQYSTNELNEELNTKPGLKTTGLTYTVGSDTFTAEEGAEAFNITNNNTNIASGYYSHAEGGETTASGDYSHAEGYDTIASGYYSHAEGMVTTASGNYSHAAGYYTIANNYQYVVGKYNKDTTAPISNTDTTASAGIFIVGIGSNSDTSSRKNGFRINPAGKAYAQSSLSSGTGVDYAEYFEWIDGNPNAEDRRGRFVTLEGEKIRYATAEDNYVLGVVSAEPCVVGGGQTEMWHNQYLTDVFGAKIEEVVEVEETTDENGKIIPAHTERRWVLNPDFDPEREYLSREERVEWDTVGIMGQLVLVDDGTCKINEYCYPSIDGIATVSESQTNYRVMSRLDDTHVKVFIK